MKPEAPNIPATRAVLTNLAFVDIAIEESKPHYMKGSGEVPEEAIAELNGVVYELRSLLSGMERYLKQELNVDLEKRLRRLQEAGRDVALLSALEQTVTRHGLVEFRPRITMLASRLEDDGFEVALFGRVSSGKSSLLNALLGSDVLPVGVNPITAMSTKLRYGPKLRAAVAYGDGRSRLIGMDELARLVTEQGNPGNLQNVVRAIVEVPSTRLREGILLVDTPGLGSLAKRGDADTLAYLPSCDLGLLLIDAGSTLNDEDIGTLRLLYDAGIPALVLLSKADLLAEEDVHRAASYFHENLARNLGLGIEVHAVSALKQHSVMLDRFYERELLPRFERARSLKEASIARKIGALREAVVYAIEVSLDRLQRTDLPPQASHPTHLGGMESRLRGITGEVGSQGTELQRACLEIGETPHAVVDPVVDRVVLSVHDGGATRFSSLQLAEWIQEAVWQLVQRPIKELREIGLGAIADLQRAAKELGHPDTPSREDLELLLRGMPRFELAARPPEVNVSHWNLFGERIVRARVKAGLADGFGPLLKDELHLYGMALAQWSEQTVTKLGALTNSYADTYRAQLQRVCRDPETMGDVGLLQADLECLRAWPSEGMACASGARG